MTNTEIVETGIAKATFTNNITGDVSITSFGEVTVNLENLSGFDAQTICGEENTEYSYHIHTIWDETNDVSRYGSDDCGASITGGHFNPFDKDACELNEDYYQCEVGDLSGRFGKINVENDKLFQSNFLKSSTNSFIPEAVADRSVVFHCSNGNRAFCAPFKLETTSGVIHTENNSDIDEKEIDSFNSELIKFDPSVTDYQCKLEISQPKNQIYGLMLNMYDIVDNGDENKESSQVKKRIDYKPIYVDFVDKFFKDGIIKAIGTNYGKSQFINPVISGEIAINSNFNPFSGKINNITGRINDNIDNYFIATCTSGKNCWFSVNFGGCKIKPVSYSLKHDKYNDYYMRDWNLEGSNDGINWTILKQHKNDTTINEANKIFGWKIDECDQTYKIFRVNMTGRNAKGEWWLHCAGFEICGHLSGHTILNPYERK
eukprot:90677_1